MTTILEARGVGRVFGAAALAVRALHPSDLALKAGEVVVLTGPSGSGKTTLLGILGLVLSPTEGEVHVGGARVTGLGPDALAGVRRRVMGYVFQQFNLLSGLTAVENVEMPLLLEGSERRARRRRAAAALDAVGLAGLEARKPRELSGGQQQRVAVARALVTNPRVVLCDEPTASLDAEAGGVVLDHLRGLTRGGDRSVLVVTHDPRVDRIADRVVRVAEGRIQC